MDIYPQACNCQHLDFWRTFRVFAAVTSLQVWHAYSYQPARMQLARHMAR